MENWTAAESAAPRLIYVRALGFCIQETWRQIWVKSSSNEQYFKFDSFSPPSSQCVCVFVHTHVYLREC